MTLVFVGMRQFAIILKARFGKNVKCPVFNLPMQFVID